MQYVDILFGNDDVVINFYNVSGKLMILNINEFLFYQEFKAYAEMIGFEVSIRAYSFVISTDI